MSPRRRTRRHLFKVDLQLVEKLFFHTKVPGKVFGRQVHPDQRDADTEYGGGDFRHGHSYGSINEAPRLGMPIERRNLQITRHGETVMQFIWFLLIGIAAGWLAGQIMKGGGFGIVGDLVVGVIGALLGGWLFGLVGVGMGGLLGQLVVATVGAIVLLLLLRLIRKSP